MTNLLISTQRNLDILGLKGLHSYLLAQGLSSYLLYLPKFDEENLPALEKLEDFIRHLRPSFIGISLMAIDLPYAIAVTHFLKQKFSNIPILWGGIHPTTCPEACLEYADYVCIGEGELTLRSVAQTLSQGGSLKTVRNLAWLEGGSLCQNSLYPLIEDLDSLPSSRQIPRNSFVQLKTEIVPVETKHLKRHKRYRGGIYKILTSRGCPYHCSYCVNSFLRKLYPQWHVRRRSIAHVIKEVSYAINEGPELAYVDFTDDCFLSCSMDYLEDFCQQYKAQIARPFIVKGTPKYITSKKMDMLADAGLAWINVGLQSGSDQVCRNIYQRNISAAEFLAAAQIISKHDIAAYYDILVDNPFESVEDKLKTIDTLLATPRPFATIIFSLNFYYGTEIYKRAQQESPELLENTLTKDYRFREKAPSTTLIEMSNLLHRPLMRFLIVQYKKKPQALRTHCLLALAKAYCYSVLLPLSYLRLIYYSQRRSAFRFLQSLPLYFHDGMIYYLSSFSLFKKKSSNPIDSKGS